MTSNISNSNQLKLNLDAFVNKLNLVNVVHKPQPIVIEKISSNNGRGNNDYERTYFTNANPTTSYEFIDENKMSMYSYLIQRDMKTKEWLSKFEQGQYDSDLNLLPKVEDPKPTKPETPRTNGSKSVSSVKNPAFTSNQTQKIRPPNKPVPAKAEAVAKVDSHSTIFSTKPSEITELRKCADDIIKSIEHLETQLSEFKLERLKVIYNDPVEEEKNKRINLEQIKYLSRSMYNLQNQISRFKSQYYKQGNARPSSIDSKKLLTPVGRLLHSIKQVNKLVANFSELYPYRPDNDMIAEKLCFHFYKQLHSSITYFTEALHIIPSDETQIPSSFPNHLADLLIKCDKYFTELNAGDDDSSKKPVKQNDHAKAKGKKSNSPLRVIRTSRTVPNSKNKKKEDKPVNTKKANPKKDELVTEINVNAPKLINRLDISPPPPRAKSETKTVKTARLYPSKQSAPMQVPKKSITNKNDGFQNRRPSPKQKMHIIDDMSGSQESIRASLSPLRNQRPSAFRHLSSPKIKPERSATRSVERINNNYGSNQSLTGRDQLSYYSRSSHSPSRSPVRFTSKPKLKDDSSRSLQDIRLRYDDQYEDLKYKLDRPNFYEDNQSYKQTTARFLPESRHQVFVSNSKPRSSRKINHMMNRMEAIRNETESIRRKYQNMDYYQSLSEKHVIDNRLRRPYEECYIDKGQAIPKWEIFYLFVEGMIVQELFFELEAVINYDQIYKTLRSPTEHQLNRIIDYANEFDDYNQKTSITKIGESVFDDFDLFRLLSNDLFDDLFNSICEEVEKVNGELSDNLIGSEFVLKESPDNSEQIKSLSSRMSIRNHTQKEQRTERPQTSNSVYNVANTSYSSFQSNDNKEEDESERDIDDQQDFQQQQTTQEIQENVGEDSFTSISS